MEASPAYESAYRDGANDAREQMQDVISEIIAQIRRGDLADAITSLEREFWPKWESIFDSHAHYVAATNEHVQPLNDGTPTGKMPALALGATIAAVNNQEAAAAASATDEVEQ